MRRQPAAVRATAPAVRRPRPVARIAAAHQRNRQTPTRTRRTPHPHRQSPRPTDSAGPTVPPRRPRRSRRAAGARPPHQTRRRPPSTPAARRHRTALVPPPPGLAATGGAPTPQQRAAAATTAVAGASHGPATRLPPPREQRPLQSHGATAPPPRPCRAAVALGEHPLQSPAANQSRDGGEMLAAADGRSGGSAGGTAVRGGAAHAMDDAARRDRKLKRESSQTDTAHTATNSKKRKRSSKSEQAQKYGPRSQRASPQRSTTHPQPYHQCKVAAGQRRREPVGREGGRARGRPLSPLATPRARIPRGARRGRRPPPAGALAPS